MLDIPLEIMANRLLLSSRCKAELTLERWHQSAVVVWLCQDNSRVASLPNVNSVSFGRVCGPPVPADTVPESPVGWRSTRKCVGTYFLMDKH